LVSWVVFYHGVAPIVAAQVKDGIYRNQFPTDMSLSLAVQVFKCLHQQANEFFHQLLKEILSFVTNKSMIKSLND
jgi:hypothetical protein